MHRLGILAAAAAVALAAGATARSADVPDPDRPLCGVAGTWVDPDAGAAIGHDRLVQSLSDRSAILLGESHTNAEHHRWQLSVLAALHGQNPNLAVGFEAFPRRVQPVLDAWSEGSLDTAEFLEKVEWNEIWGVDPDLYLPMLHFARLHRLPVVALNVERSLISRIGAEGLDAIAEDAREGVGQPATANEAYRRQLANAYLGHQGGTSAAHGTETEATEQPDIDSVLDDPAFARFVQAQQFWDRAMAEAIRDAGTIAGVSQVVGIIGRGHMEFGHGVPEQLEDLGVDNHAVLLPSAVAEDCAETVGGLATAVFLIDPVSEISGPPRLRLGVYIETSDGGAKVEKVVEGSVAEATGLVAGDVIVEAAGATVGGAADLIDTIGRQAPGTWLPLTVERDGERLDLVAKFGPADTTP